MAMQILDIIEKKKQGFELSKEEIDYFVSEYTENRLPDYQISALLMAICLQSMTARETADLTAAMLNSGERMDLSKIQGITCDKHSTGGVGDKTTLALTPMVVACGARVAKMSGRGLGHTGGTLDKLEAIKSFNVQMSEEAFLDQVNTLGLAIIGQSKNLVPADKKLYALRDVTATVQSIPLIASSIMSKKLACGSDTILLDVKYGKGAFMPTPQKALELAEAMLDIGKHFHKDVRALISNMNEPLGFAIGNALEVKEAVETLKGKGPKDFLELCLCAGSQMLQQAKLAKDDTTARAMLLEVIENGKALDKLLDMVALQGGDSNQLKHVELLPQAAYTIDIPAKQTGYIHEIHALALGKLAMRLGAGRIRLEDNIDPAVGIVLHKKCADYVCEGETLATIHTQKKLSKEWLADFYAAYSIQSTAISKTPLVYKIIT